MASSRLPPGAWLSGFIPGGGFNPPVGPRSGSNPPVGPRSGSNPPVGPHSGSNPPVGPRLSFAPGDARDLVVLRRDVQGGTLPGSFDGQWVMTRSGPMSSEPPIPWSGIDPDWVWEGGVEALRAQALRKVRDRVVPPSDPREPRSNGKEVLLGPVTMPALWRWGESFRESAVIAELLGRLVVDGFQLWWVPRPGIPQQGKPTVMFTLVPPDAAFKYSDQIDKVLRAAVEREDRLPEILTQAEDIGVFFDAITGIDRGTAPRLRELLDVAWQASTHLVMALKNNVAEWRPYQRSGRVQPVIATPGHGTLPSGHATMAVLAADLLCALLRYGDLDPRRVSLQRLARRIAFNRVVAGVHFPMDSFAGAELAHQLAKIFVATGRGESLPEPTLCKITPGSQLEELVLPPAPPPPDFALPVSEVTSKTTNGGPMTAWQLMWKAAEAEVAQRRI